MAIGEGEKGVVRCVAQEGKEPCKVVDLKLWLGLELAETDRMMPGFGRKSRCRSCRREMTSMSSVWPRGWLAVRTLHQQGPSMLAGAGVSTTRVFITWAFHRQRLKISIFAFFLPPTSTSSIPSFQPQLSRHVLFFDTRFSIRFPLSLPTIALKMFQRSLLASSRALAARPAAPAMSR